MKKIFALVITIFAAQLAFSQSISFGPRVGVSSSSIKISKENITNPASLSNLQYEAGDAKLGFHGGVFARIGLAGLFIQPEALINVTGGNITVNNINGAGTSDIYEYKDTRLNVPIMVGYKISVARVQLGPVLSYNIQSTAGFKADMATASSIAKDATYGFQAGVGLDLWKLVVDVKYEFGVGKYSDGVVINGNRVNFDQRANQIVATVGFKIL